MKKRKQKTKWKDLNIIEKIIVLIIGTFPITAPMIACTICGVLYQILGL